MKSKIALIVFFLAGISTLAFQAPKEPSPANIDRRKGRIVPANSNTAPRIIPPEFQVTINKILGTPDLVVGKKGTFLTTAPVAANVSATAAPIDAQQIVKSFVNRYNGLFQISGDALDRSVKKRDYVTAHNGVRTMIWEQDLAGIPLHQGLLMAHVTRRNELVRVSSRFIADPAAAANAVYGDYQKILKKSLTPQVAIKNAALSLGTEIDSTQITGIADALQNPDRQQTFRAPGLKGDVIAQLRWLPMNGQSLRLCWQVQLVSKKLNEMWRVLIDAENGEMLVRQTLTAYSGSASYRVFLSDSPSPYSPGLLTPARFQPPLVPRNLVEITALSDQASPDGWLPDGVNETSGNNVDAHTDLNDDDNPDLPRPQGVPFRVFDFPLDLTKQPTAYRSASVVQLFYLNNFMHDKLYEVGFTEEAGNFQNDNFGRGGVGGDAVMADGQDGGGLDNANMFTPPDGISGRMQMYIFSGPTPNRDGSLDAEVVCHEYTHGLSNRLVGGGTGIGELQTAGMGEGWSDFYALSLLGEASDDLNGDYAAGGYASYLIAGLGLDQNYYFGIRRYPYTTDMSRNPLTFKDIDPTQASLHQGIPISPVFGDSDPGEVHAQGEVWCVTLWGMRANLIQQYGFEQGNRLTLQLVTDGMKFAPIDPTFLEARDAIVQADLVNNAGANRDLIWAAFAKRGMGYSAKSPTSDDTVGVEESYDVPDDLEVTPNQTFVASGEDGGPFSNTSQDYDFTDQGAAPVVWEASGFAPWLRLSSLNGTLQPGESQTVTVSLDPVLYSLPAGTYETSIKVLNKTTSRSQTRRVIVRIGQPDYLTQELDGSRSVTNSWITFTPDTSPTGYTVCFEPASSLGTPALGGTPLTIKDSSYAQVTLANGAKVSLFGKQYDSFYVSDNGNITFDRGAVEYYESIRDHFNMVRISPFFDDLDPSFGGSIVWSQLADRVVVTYSNISEWRNFNQNTFQVELFFDGRIRFSYGNIESLKGIIGLSRGTGLPDQFTPTDFFSFPACVPFARLNAPASLAENAGSANATIHLEAAPDVDLPVSIVSSRPGLISAPATVVVPAGQTDATFALQVHNDTLLNATRIVRLSASADGYRTSSAKITVTDDEKATLSLVVPSQINEGAGAISGSVTLNANAAEALIVKISSDDPTQIGTDNAVLIPAGQKTAPFQILPVDDRRIDRDVSVTLRATVENWFAAAQPVTVVDNEDRLLRVNVHAFVGENKGIVQKFGTVSISGTLATDLVVTLESSAPGILATPQQVTIRAGETRASFDATLFDNTAIDGTRSVTITARATAFTDGSATAHVVDNESPVAPIAPSPAHLSTNNPVFVDLAWQSGLGEIVQNGGFESGSFDRWQTRNTANGGFAINTPGSDPANPSFPFAGSFSAICTQTGPGHRELSQEIQLPNGITGALLTWADKFQNDGPFVAGEQEYRVEIRSTSDEVLALAFSTDVNSTNVLNWTPRAFDLADFAGQTIRIVFVQENAFAAFTVELDSVSVVTEGGAPDSWDVYLNTAPTFTPAQLLGNTAAPHWDLPNLTLETTYYWQVVAHKGAARLTGPVWQFTVPGIGPVDGFTVSGLGSQTFYGAPVPITITAVDERFNHNSDYQGPVQLAAQRILPTRTVGLDTQTSADPFFSTWEDARSQMIYLSSELGAARKLTAISLDVSAIPGKTLTHFTIRAKNVTYTAFGTNPGFDRSGWTVLFQKDITITSVGWQTFRFTQPYVYDGASNLMLDISFNDNNFSLDPGGCRATDKGASRILSGHSDSTDGDPLTWSGSMADATASTIVPNIRFEGVQDVGITPDVADSLVGGVWTGLVQFDAPLDGVRVIATDAAGHRGESDVVDIVAQNDINVNVTVTPDSPITGNDVVYDLRVRNTGPQLATGVILSNYCTGGAFTLIRSNSTAGSLRLDGATLVADMGTMLPGATETVHLVYRPNFIGKLTNTCDLVRNEADGYPLNNHLETVSVVIAKPRVTIDDLNIDEGDSGSTRGVVIVHLTPPVSVDVTADWATVASTATEGVDYLKGSGTIVIPAGQTRAFIPVDVLGDTLDEKTEVFTVRLSNVTNAFFGKSSASVRINDNDGPNISVSSPSVLEGNSGTTSAIFKVTFDHASPKTITISYDTSDGTALAGSDYVAASSSVTFNPGDLSKLVTISIRGDILDEPDEYFFVDFTSDFGSFTNSHVRGTILNDDGLPGNIYKLAATPIASPQYANNRFSMRLDALDKAGRPATNFNQSVALSAVVSNPDVLAGSGHQPSLELLDTFYEDRRETVLYLASDIGAARQLTALSLNVLSPPVMTLTRFTIRVKQTTATSFNSPSFEATGWTTLFQANTNLTAKGWTKFYFRSPYIYNGTSNLIFDFSINNADYDFSDNVVEATVVAADRAFYGTSDSFDGDPLNWSGFTGFPEFTPEIPNVLFHSEPPIAITPSTTAAFFNGQWSGQVQLSGAGAPVVIRARSTAGYDITTLPFTVLSGLDSDGDGIPDAWEDAHGLNRGSAADAVLDNDNDGISNLQEFRANTDPAQPDSTVRISAVGAADSLLQLQFTALSGQGYLIERSGSIDQGWVTVGFIMGKGTAETFADKLTANDAVFYRVTATR